MSSSLSDPLRLPCGLELRNRVLKAALAEQMTSTSAHEPDAHFTTAYRTWGAGGWGAVLTGNVQVDPTYLGAPKDVMLGDNLDDERTKRLWREYADAVQHAGAAGIVQLNHPGRQSPIGAGAKSLFQKNVAPSAIALDMGDAYVAKAAGALLWGTPREMSVDEIQYVVSRFAICAKFLFEAGFKGIELHAAHGYLLAQFLSAKSNQRTDQYGGSAANRARIVVEIIEATRAAISSSSSSTTTPNRDASSFAIGIKLNSVDHQHASSLTDSMAQIALIRAAGIDFLEISGGSYEDTLMMQDVSQQNNAARKQSSHSSAREAFFIEFARIVRNNFPDIVLMLTGGFRTRAGMQAAVSEGACDLVGLGRVSIVEPDWPATHLSAKDDVGIWLDLVPQSWILKMIPVKAVGAGAENEYYAKQIRRLGRGLASVAPGRSVVAKL